MIAFPLDAVEFLHGSISHIHSTKDLAFVNRFDLVQDFIMNLDQKFGLFVSQEMGYSRKLASYEVIQLSSTIISML